MTNSINNIANIYDEILRFQNERKKAEKAFQRKMAKLKTPIKELKKYYTVLIQYDWGSEIEMDFRTKAEAMKFFATKMNNAKKHDELEDIIYAGLFIVKDTYKTAIQTKYNICNI